MTMAKFLYNRWYAAAWPNEIPADKPFNRKILSEDITFYRKADGAAVAVSSRCPHRFAPMYNGKVVGDNIRCPYHGLEFGPGGNCVRNPDGSPAPNAHLKSYPLVEQDSMVWIWIGDKEPSAELPGQLKFPEDMGGFVRGLVHVEGHFQLLLDNLLDQSHVPHLHSMLKTDALVKHSKPTVKQEGDSVWCTSWAPGEKPNPFWLAQGYANVPIDQQVEARWDAPSTITVTAQITPTGQPIGEGIGNISVHLITPETEGSSHYFWCMVRNGKKDDHEFSEAVRANLTRIFNNEDKWVIEGQVKMMEGEEFWSLRPVLLPQDRATAMCRRHIDKLMSEQQKETAVAAE
jgi:phenylpropionate dioxygenase-like ring-hydroxylating dioxygenase large terminal subunit